MSEFPITRWSYSSLSSWDQCPAKWHATYIEKLRSDTIESVRGSLAHEVLELFAAVPAAERTLDMLMGFNATVLSNYDGEFKSAAFDKQVTDRVRNAWHIERWSAVPATEIESELTMTTDAGNIFRGFADRIDRVGDELVTTDYKSGRVNFRYAAPAVSKQLAVYCLMLRARGDNSSTARAVYLGSGTAPSNILRFRYTDEDLAGVMRWIDSTIQEIKEFYVDGFDVIPPAIGSALCNWCPKKYDCNGPKEANVTIR